MKLLICTQKMDASDDVLGFMHRWTEEFAKNFETVTVVCLYKGAVSLPAHVTVVSLGKEESVSRLTYLWRFFSYIVMHRREYDAVFVHMNQIYVILGAWWWRLTGKVVGFWYAHGHTPFGVRVAEKLTHIIFTSTEGGFRLPSAKKHIIGQGIDMQQFAGCARTPGEAIRLISVGRLSPIKNYETLIRAGALLKKRGVSTRITIVGGADGTQQVAYYETLKQLVEELGLGEEVVFLGSVPNRELAQHLCTSDIFVNTSMTGSLDKAGLEALASGIPLLTCNDAFAVVFGTESARYMFDARDTEALADLIVTTHTDADTPGRVEVLREVVRHDHSIETFVPKIRDIFEGAQQS